MQCTNQALLRALLAGSPLNIGMVGIWVLVYIFMPAAIFGPALGLLGTVALAAVAAYLWMWSIPEALNLYLSLWLAWSAVDVLVSVLIGFVSAVLRFRKGRSFIAPSNDESAELTPGAELQLEFAQGESCSREMVVRVPVRGVYVLSSHVQGEEEKACVQLDDRACMAESEYIPALVNAEHAAYRLEPGCHRLTVHVQSDTASCVRFSFR